MPALSEPFPRPSADHLAALRAEIACVRMARGPSLPFGLTAIDDRLADGGIYGAGLHEIAAASPTLGDEAASMLFAVGIAARFAAKPGFSILWALTHFDLYAPGIEQTGLAPKKILYAEGRKDSDVLALAEDGLRNGSLACVIAEVKVADQTATRRLQLAASDGNTPILLIRRHKARDRCPLAQPSSAMTRWLVGCRASTPLPYSGVGHGRWSVELVRQRNGNPFSLEVEACDAQGRLALPAATADRAVAPVGAASSVA